MFHTRLFSCRRFGIEYFRGELRVGGPDVVGDSTIILSVQRWSDRGVRLALTQAIQKWYSGLGPIEGETL